MRAIQAGVEAFSHASALPGSTASKISTGPGSPLACLRAPTNSGAHVSDLIEAIRNHVGTCNLISGVHIEAHGGWSGSGGFRMGNDTNGNGHIESGEAQDFVSTQSRAAKFGAIIKNALAPNAFISVAACGSAGNNNDFIKALQAATGAIVIGTPSGCRSGGSWFSGAWWECDEGRVQINKEGTTKVDASDDGTGIWKPF